MRLRPHINPLQQLLIRLYLSIQYKLVPISVFGQLKITTFNYRLPSKIKLLDLHNIMEMYSVAF